MAEAVIVAAARSPIGRANKGSMTGLRADDLAATIVRAALDQVPGLDPNDVDDLLLGCATPGGEQGFNMARVVAVLLGLDSVPGTTVTRYCSSSLQTTRMAFHAIRAGEGHVFLSAGVEAVSRYTNGNSDRIPATKNPRFDDAQRRSSEHRNGNGRWTSARARDELPDVYIAMLRTAENVATLMGVTRAEQDEFALRSQTLHRQAAEAGFWAAEITPVELPDGSLLEADECPRPTTTLDGLSALEPVLGHDGTVTAGNACPLNDGAAALVVMSDERARELGVQPLARIVATGVSALDPEIMGLGPIDASTKALQKAGMVMDDVDLVEMNEAFAAQVLPSARALDIDLEKLNVHGGGIAVGHPFGMTGARLTGTLLNGLRARDGTIGLETMCVGGGQGMAMIVERLA
jgi:acetyl-CoA C-acetyltransferase